MEGSLRDVDAQRARWARYRASQAMTLDAGEDFASGGLGRHVEQLDLRLVFLPSDPEADVVPLDGETLGWLKELRQSPFGGRYPAWGSCEQATSSALVLYDHNRDGTRWRQFLALHRHGGIEVGLDRLGYKVHDTRALRLRPIVGYAWLAAALQAEAIARWRIQAPFELTVGIRNTKGATLTDFAGGWPSPALAFGDFPTCLEDHVLLRREANDAVDPERFAVGLGDRLEQAFGSINRRHIAPAGDYQGRFDPPF